MPEIVFPEEGKVILQYLEAIYSQIGRLWVDDSARLVTRVGYLDDGWVRIRLDGHWEFTGELLRELSWMFYSIAETNNLLDIVSGALASKATDKLRASIVDPLPESPLNIVKVAGTAQTGRDWSLDFAKLQNLDVSLSVLAKLIKFNRSVSPAWVYGSEATAPASGTSLVSKTVGSGKSGYVYGVFISAGEANEFKLSWVSGGSTYGIRIPFSSKGAIYSILDVPINEGLPASSGSTITLTNINAGSTGAVYQAGVLYVEI